MLGPGVSVEAVNALQDTNVSLEVIRAGVTPEQDLSYKEQKDDKKNIGCRCIEAD